MNLDSPRRHPLALAALATTAVAIASIFLLAGGSKDSSAGSEAAPNKEFSALKPVGPGAKDALPDKAKAWIADLEESSLSATKGKALLALGSTDTEEGEIILADFGHEVCAFSVVQGASVCGTPSLSREGKLVAAIPGCGSVVVFGVVPDKVTEVRVDTVRPGDGDSNPPVIPVSSNVFTAELASVETVISGVTDSGVAYDASLPLANTPSTC